MPANYVLLERIELNASASSVTFNSIPQSGYTDLKVVVSARTDNAATTDAVLVNLNGVSTNQTTRRLQGDGTSVVGTSSTSIFFTVDGNTATSNTFSNAELNFSNYNSTTNYKAISIDNVNETNATTASSQLFSSLWSSNSAITSIQIACQGSNFLANSTFSLYGLAAVGSTPATAPKAEGGDSAYSDGTYWYHIFTSSGSLKINTAVTANYLVVAGGGGGGIAGNARGGGGGGAGGYRTASSQSLSSGTYTVTVGSGGAGSTDSVYRGSSGTASSFNGMATTGGGGGGSTDNTGVINGLTGGSGGGGANFNNATASGGTGNAGSYSPVEGYTGGAGYNSVSGANGGGGGGSSAVGTAGGGTGSIGGAGGAGTANSITGTSVTYATGGAGGGTTSASIGANGTKATGNGGQGNANNYAGGAGGSGIVIIRYAI